MLFAMFPKFVVATCIATACLSAIAQNTAIANIQVPTEAVLA